VLNPNAIGAVGKADVDPPTPQGGLKKKCGFKVPPGGFRGKKQE